MASSQNGGGPARAQKEGVVRFLVSSEIIQRWSSGWTG